MKYKINDGIFIPDFELSRLELDMFDWFMKMLKLKNYMYLSVPTTINRQTLVKQEVNDAYSFNFNQILGGSAEQGILQYFQNTEVNEMKIYAKNTCFRVEKQYDAVRLKEFQKIEQFSFCNQKTWRDIFSEFLENVKNFLKEYNIKFRTVDMTSVDQGYHRHKINIEIYTSRWGWIESHSATYFANEQSRRFSISGDNHTISCTGIASYSIAISIDELVTI